MKTLTISQLEKWKPCGEYITDFEKKFGSKAPMVAVEKELLGRKDFSAVSWLIGKRLERLKKRQVCAFAYRCSYRSLKYARKQDVEILGKAISFAKIYAETGRVDKESARSAAESAARSAAESAARSAAESAWSAAESARSAARSAAESAWSAAESARSAAESARSARSAARSAAESAEYKWQLEQLSEIEIKLPKKL